MSCCVGPKCSSDPVLLWLWHTPEAAALILSLAWERPYATGVALKDEKLSLRAKGLYAIIQNYVTLEDFTIYKSYLISVSGDGKSSFDRAWDELKEHGYLVQYQMQDATGKIYYEYDLLDEPRELSEEEKAAYAQKEANRKARNQRKVAARKQKSRNESA